MVFELCAANSSHLHSHSPGGAAVRRRVLAEVQLENMFSSSAVKLCLRRSRLVSLRYSRCTVSVIIVALSHTHTHPFNGPLPGTARVSRYQKGKTSLDSTEARDSEWQWHQLGHMQVCTSLQTDSHASTPPLSFFRPDALPDGQPTASKH